MIMDLTKCLKIKKVHFNYEIKNILNKISDMI